MPADVSWDHHPTSTAVDMAAAIGRLRYDRDLLLRQIEAIEAGLEDGSATHAWEHLKATVRWMRTTELQREA